VVREQFESSERFFIEIRQTDVVQKEFNLWAVIIDCNCKEGPKTQSSYQNPLVLVTQTPNTWLYV
jgi:hypothetical protein